MVLWGTCTHAANRMLFPPACCILRAFGQPRQFHTNMPVEYNVDVDDHREGGDADGEDEEEVDHEGEER